MCSRVVYISGPKATEPVLPLSADAGRDIDDRDIAKRKACLELGQEESVRLGSLHALIETAKNAFTEAFHTYIPSLRRLVPGATSLNWLRASLLKYFSRLISPGLNSIPSHNDRQTAGHEVNILAALSRLIRRDDYLILRAGSGREGLALQAANRQVTTSTETAGTATSEAPLVLLIAMIGTFMATSPCRAHERKQRPYGQDVDDGRLRYAGTGNPDHARH